MKLGKNLRTTGRGSRFMGLLQDIGARGLSRSSSMRTAVRLWSNGDFILCQRDGHAADGEVSWIGCIAVEFWSTRDSMDHYLVAELCHLDAAPSDIGTSWLYRRTRTHIAVHHSRLVMTCSCIEEGNQIRVVLPMYVRRILG